MNLSIGIVGLPNVGKSTLFNALLKKQQALAVNYPFATIEPNIGVVAVPDERLEKLAEVIQNDPSTTLRTMLPPIKPTTVQFIDIAGLVKGAHTGAGLGNKFLSHIREVSVIAHVVRAFENPDIIREGSIDPKTDYETVHTELLLADLQTLEHVQQRLKKSSDTQQKNVLEKLMKGLNGNQAVRDISLTEEETTVALQWSLLSHKKELIVLNVAEEKYREENIPIVIKNYSDSLHIPLEHFVVVSAQIESELASLSQEEQKEYLKGLHLNSSGLERLIQNAYKTLGLISFLTAGEKEVRAWTIEKGTTAQHAAGAIHSDFEKHFIRADIVPYEIFIKGGGWRGCREKGKVQTVGRDHLMQDGDVVEFKVGV